MTPGRMGSDTDQPARAWDRIYAFYQQQLGS